MMKSSCRGKCNYLLKWNTISKWLANANNARFTRPLIKRRMVKRLPSKFNRMTMTSATSSMMNIAFYAIFPTIPISSTFMACIANVLKMDPMKYGSCCRWVLLYSSWMIRYWFVKRIRNLVKMPTKKSLK